MKQENTGRYNSKNLFYLTSNDLAKIFGTTHEELKVYCADQISVLNFHYYKLEGEERDQIIIKALKQINSEKLAVAGRERQPEWKIGWSENLKEFIKSGYDVDKLVPKYYKKNAPVRLNRNYIMPIDNNFVFNVTNVFRSWIFQRYFQKVGAIYEFGCGSAFHLAFLARMYPQKKLFGFDWVEPSQEIIRLLAQHYRWPIKGGKFDFFHPDENLEIEPNSAIFTFGALEQVGRNHGPFLNFILKKFPQICINIEGLIELYEEDKLLDYLAFKYHKRRNYLDGYLSRLRGLEKEGKIEIIKVHHQLFGNLFDDPHSYVIWKPKN